VPVKAPFFYCPGPDSGNITSTELREVLSATGAAYLKRISCHRLRGTCDNITRRFQI